MAWDLLLRRETETNWSRGPVPASTPMEWSPTEIRALKLLEQGTREHVIEVVGWARGKGIPARLSAQSVIYTPAESAKHYTEGRSGIAPGRLDWHQVGRAYHLVIVDPATKKLDEPAYARVGAFVRSKGGEWLGDKVIVTPRGRIKDLAHYEFHPDWDIATYRKLPLAQVEYKRAQDRAAKYG